MGRNVFSIRSIQGNSGFLGWIDNRIEMRELLSCEDGPLAILSLECDLELVLVSMDDGSIF